MAKPEFGPEFGITGIENCRIMDSLPVFNCIEHLGFSCEVQAIYRIASPDIGDFLVSCHDQQVRVSIPIEAFVLASHHRGEMYFVVGFEGDWSVKVRRYPKTQAEFSDPPLGRFTHEQLGQLFGKGPAGLPMNPMHFGFRPQYYTIHHEPTGVEFPAQFWYRAAYERGENRA